MRKKLIVLVLAIAAALAAIAVVGGKVGGAVAAPPASPAPRASWEELQRDLDLGPLRALAIQQGGRRKPLDTYAREIVSWVLGSRSHAGQDPLFTCLSMAFEPEAWRDVPCLKVRYLKLSRLFGREEAGPRLTPGEVVASAAFREAVAAIDPHEKMLGPFQEAAKSLELRVSALYDWRTGEWGSFIPMNLTVVPAPGAKPDDPWLPAALGGVGHGHGHGHGNGRDSAEHGDAEVALEKLALAFRARDVAAANTAIEQFTAEVGALQARLAPAPWRLRLEVLYNRVHPFQVGYYLYALAFALFVVASVTGARGATVAAWAVALPAFLLHVAGLATRTIILARAPVGNIYETIIFVAFAAVLFGVLFEAKHRTGYFGAAFAGVASLSLILADVSQLESFLSPLQPVLATYWLNIHTTTMLLSYGAFATAFGVGIAYFATWMRAHGMPSWSIVVPLLFAAVGGAVPLARSMVQNEMPTWPHFLIAFVVAPAAGAGAAALWYYAGEYGKTDAAGGRPVPFEAKLELASLERYTVRAIQVGFTLLTAGVILGAVWANESWGRYWGWDNKETWAFITWLIYGILIHGRLAGWWKGATSAIWSVVGFYSVLFTWFGVSFILPGLHSYLKKGG